MCTMPCHPQATGLASPVSTERDRDSHRMSTDIPFPSKKLGLSPRAIRYSGGGVESLGSEPESDEILPNPLTEKPCPGLPARGGSVQSTLVLRGCDSAIQRAPAVRFGCGARPVHPPRPRGTGLSTPSTHNGDRKPAGRAKPTTTNRPRAGGMPMPCERLAMLHGTGTGIRYNTYRIRGYALSKNKTH